MLKVVEFRGSTLNSLCACGLKHEGPLKKEHVEDQLQTTYFKTSSILPITLLTMLHFPPWSYLLAMAIECSSVNLVGLKRGQRTSKHFQPNLGV